MRPTTWWKGATVSKLRDLVTAWREQADKCASLFKMTLEAINKELGAVGGYATTSPDAQGYCRGYSKGDYSFGGGVTKTPEFTAVGDRCFELEMAWRKEVEEKTRRAEAVRTEIARWTGPEFSELEPEYIAWAIFKSKEVDGG